MAHLIIWSCMSHKRSQDMAIIASAVNAQVYIAILDHFLILFIENRFGDEEIFQKDDNSSYLGSKFFFRKGISTEWHEKPRIRN